MPKVNPAELKGQQLMDVGEANREEDEKLTFGVFEKQEKQLVDVFFGVEIWKTNIMVGSLSH